MMNGVAVINDQRLDMSDKHRICAEGKNPTIDRVIGKYLNYRK